MSKRNHLYESDGNGGLIAYPHAGQQAVLESKARFTGFIGGTQVGKTVLAVLWSVVEYRRRVQVGLDELPDVYTEEQKYQAMRKYAAGDYLVATPTYQLLTSKFLPELRRLYEDILGLGRYHASIRAIEIADPDPYLGFLGKTSTSPMHARLLIKSAESSGGLESMTANAAILDEFGHDIVTIHHWEAVLRRVSTTRGRVLVPTTPYNSGWLKSEFYDRWKSGDKNFNVIQVPSFANPSFPKEEYERIKNTMQKYRFDMFYRGEFGVPTNRIYQDFEDCFVPEFKIPHTWRRVIGVDFGGANTATVHLAQNPETWVWYLYKETLDGGMPTAGHVARQLSHLEGVRFYRFVGGAPNEVQSRSDWEHAGIYVMQPEISDVEAGIDRVQSLFTQKEIRIFDNLKIINQQLNSYKRKLDREGVPTSVIADKHRFHTLDALRYAAVLIRPDQSTLGLSYYSASVVSLGSNRR